MLNLPAIILSMLSAINSHFNLPLSNVCFELVFYQVCFELVLYQDKFSLSSRKKILWNMFKVVSMPEHNWATA